MVQFLGNNNLARVCLVNRNERVGLDNAFECPHCWYCLYDDYKLPLVAEA